MNVKKIIWVIVVAILIAGSFLAGLAFGNSGTGGIAAVNGNGSFAQGFAAAMAEARKKVADSGMFPPESEEILTISGTVKSVDGNKIVIVTNGRIALNPLSEQGPKERIVMINDKAQVVAHIPRTSEEQAVAIKEYQEKINSNDNTAVPPSPFIEKIVDVDSIKISMVITVTAAENIKTAATINAVKVTFDAIPSNIAIPPAITP